MGWPQNVWSKIDMIENAKSSTVIAGDTSTTFSIIIEQPAEGQWENRGANNSLDQLNPGDMHTYSNSEQGNVHSS